MNLISCENCGVVLDLSRIEMPDIEDEDRNVNTEIAAWVDRDYVPTIVCPCCKGRILYSNRRRA